MKVADTPAALMAEVDVACTCVATPAALEEVAAGKDGLLSAARRGQLWIDFSTIGPEQARSFEQRAAAVGVDFVEAPVTGSKTGAEKGTLLIMAGGEHGGAVAGRAGVPRRGREVDPLRAGRAPAAR